MSATKSSKAVEFTAVGAAQRIHSELALAERALSTGDLDEAFDAYVRALGLALQLGPGPTEQVLAASLLAARELVQRGEATGLSTLGPALVDLVTQVREADVLPATAIMEAWATVAADLGALVGQIGLVLTLPPDRRAGMLANAQSRAALLDEATHSLFDLTAWLDTLDPTS